MGAERPVAFCAGATPMQVSRCGTLPNQTVAKYRGFFGVPKNQLPFPRVYGRTEVRDQCRFDLWGNPALAFHFCAG